MLADGADETPRTIAAGLQVLREFETLTPSDRDRRRPLWFR